MCFDPFYHETQISGDMTRQEWNLPKKKYLLDGAHSTSHWATMDQLCTGTIYEENGRRSYQGQKRWQVENNWNRKREWFEQYKTSPFSCEKGKSGRFMTDALSVLHGNSKCS